MEKTRGEILEEMFANVESGILVFDDIGTVFSNKLARESDEIKRSLKYGRERILEEGNNLIGRSIEKFDAIAGVWFNLRYSNLDWFDGRIVTMITATDCTVRKKSYKRQEFQQYNDPLTGLYNSAKCEVDLKATIDEIKKNGGEGAFILIDLDNFKNINDGLGRAYGDMLLREIAIGIHNMWGLSANCYRLGGDEFAVLITPSVFGQLDRILNSLHGVFNTPWVFMDSECYCTMSAGVVVFPKYGDDVSNIMKNVDIAMYNAKRAGKNAILFYEEKDVSAIRKLEIESNMRQAVAEECEEFVIYYQPIVDSVTEECVSCEALIRWNSKNLGFVGPGEFIPMAEYLGLINEIGDNVLIKACSQCKKWNDHGFPDFRININLSVIQLLQSNVIENIREVLEESEVNPKNITLEVTESLAITDMDRMMNVLAKIKKLGVKTALDDFGTGYSSLNYIKQLDFDIIKVDKSFVDDVTKDEYQKAFVELIVDLSNRIGAKVCVEGVEEKEQFELLKEIGANLIQGYYFGKPMPAAEFERKFLYKI